MANSTEGLGVRTSETKSLIGFPLEKPISLRDSARDFFATCAARGLGSEFRVLGWMFKSHVQDLFILVQGSGFGVGISSFREQSKAQSDSRPLNTTWRLH